MKIIGQKEYAEVPEEIRNGCGEEDLCGILGEKVWWWYEKKTKDLHLVAGKGETEPDRPDDNTLRMLRMEEPRNVIVHEGLESEPIDFWDWSIEFEELILPDTTRTIPKIKGDFKVMVVPPTVKSMNITNLFVTCGGHWDPVTYAVKRLILPSGIVFENVKEEEINYRDAYGRLPICEPIEYWDEIIIYGEEKLQDLSSWIDANIFYHRFTIFYPRTWDEGKTRSYADEVLAHIRARNPERPRFGMAPAGWDPFTEREYQYIRDHLVPYGGSKGACPIHPAAFPSPEENR